MNKLFVGIDLSVRSSGLALYSPSEKKIWTYFYATRKKDISRTYQSVCSWQGNTAFSTEAFPRQLSDMPLIEKYTQVTSDIIHTIQRHMVDRDAVFIRMEGYAFGARSSSSSKLHEIGGILKYRIHEKGYEMEELPPTSLKKHFTGLGNASKCEMYNRFVELGFPMLMSEFGFTEIDSDKGDIPNPIQDVVDACALVSSMLDTEPSPSKKRKR